MKYLFVLCAALYLIQCFLNFYIGNNAGGSGYLCAFLMAFCALIQTLQIK